jgi:hypothetical protein
VHPVLLRWRDLPFVLSQLGALCDLVSGAAEVKCDLGFSQNHALMKVETQQKNRLIEDHPTVIEA